MSGQYNLNPENPGRFGKAYYGSNREKYAEMSVINNLDGLQVPLFIIFAEFDPPSNRDAECRTV
jgi:hypothetical protein